MLSVSRCKRNWSLTAALVVLCVVVAASVSSCGQAPPASQTAPLLVAAASSLQPAFGEMQKAFTAKTGRQVTLNYGATGNLAKQIENGAPIDVFAAADTGYVDGLEAKGFIMPDSKAVYAVGRLMLATQDGLKVPVNRVEDLTRPEIKRVAIADPVNAPYGRAAKEVLVKLGLWSAVEPKLVYGDNVQATLQFVQTGNAEAAIVARSLSPAAGIRFTPIDSQLHAPIQQSMAIVEATKNEALAREFVAFVLSAEGQRSLQKYGYLSPEVP